MAPSAERGRLQRLHTFFHPLDGVQGWNRIYGKRGFVQYQFVVPVGQEGALAGAVERLSRLEAPPLSTTPERVAEVIVRALETGAEEAWAPPLLHVVMTGVATSPARCSAG